jgi:uncharacterized Zn-binding protein involved in type VI secretion
MVFAAARKGDRFSHNSHFSDSSNEVLIAVVVGGLSSQAGSGGAMCSAFGAGMSSAHAGGVKKGSVTVRDVVPNSTSGEIEDGSKNTFAVNLPLALAAFEKVSCDHHSDKPIRTGSKTVFANRKHVARQADTTCCGALICDGAETVLVGGPPDDSAPSDRLDTLPRSPAASGVVVGGAITGLEHPPRTASTVGTTLIDGGSPPVTATVVGHREGGGASSAVVGAALQDTSHGAIGAAVTGDTRPSHGTGSSRPIRAEQTTPIVTGQSAGQTQTANSGQQPVISRTIPIGAPDQRPSGSSVDGRGGPAATQDPRVNVPTITSNTIPLPKEQGAAANASPIVNAPAINVTPSQSPSVLNPAAVKIPVAPTLPIQGPIASPQQIQAPVLTAPSTQGPKVETHAIQAPVINVPPPQTPPRPAFVGAPALNTEGGPAPTPHADARAKPHNAGPPEHAPANQPKGPHVMNPHVIPVPGRPGPRK